MSPTMQAGDATTDERLIFKSTAKQVRQLPNEALTCRAGNHSWRPLTAERVRGGYVRTEQCGNDCGCVRSQELNRWGIVLKSSIRYPKGYLLKGIGRLTGTAKGAVRVEAIERVIRGEIT